MSDKPALPPNGTEAKAHAAALDAALATVTPANRTAMVYRIRDLGFSMGMAIDMVDATIQRKRGQEPIR